MWLTSYIYKQNLFHKHTLRAHDDYELGGATMLLTVGEIEREK